MIVLIKSLVTLRFFSCRDKNNKVLYTDNTVTNNSNSQGRHFSSFQAGSKVSFRGKKYDDICSYTLVLADNDHNMKKGTLG